MRLRPKSFDEAATAYATARRAVDAAETESALERAIDRSDRALDVLLAVPSPTIRAFGEKLRALKTEYGLAWQERHAAALLADCAMLSAG